MKNTGNWLILMVRKARLFKNNWFKSNKGFADNVAVTAGTGTTVAADEINDGTLGSCKVQFVKLMDGTLDSTNKLLVNSGGAAAITGSTSVVNVVTITGSTAVISLPAITGSTSVVNTVAVTGSVVALGGTAGTSGTNVLSVQGIASMVPLSVTGSTVVVGTVAITGSTEVLNTVTITGSTAVVSMPTVTITGSTTIANTLLAVTGSTTVVNVVTVTGSTTLLNASLTVTGSTTLNHIAFPNAAVATVNVTGATTNLIVVPSHATLSIYLTDLIISNGATAGWLNIAQVSTLTAGNLKLQPLYFAVNGGMAHAFRNPIKLDATTDLVATTATATTLSITATYYHAA